MTRRDHRTPRLGRLWICLGLWPVGLAAGVSALADGEKAPVTAADYARWETLAPGASLSPDGKWLAYGITRGDGKYELRARALDPAADARTQVFPFGGGAVFSDDSRWLAFAVGSADDERVRNPPSPARPGPSTMKKLGLLNLLTRENATIENVAAFAFSKGGGYLAIHRPVPTPARPNPGATPPTPAPASPAEDKPSPGADLLVRDLTRGAVVSFGNVAAFAWQDRDGGHLLAMVVHAEGDLGRSVQLYDPATGLLRVLDSGGASYSGLAWRKDSDDLAALRARTVPDRQEPTQVVLAWRGVSDPKAQPKTLDPTAAAGFPADTRVVAARPLKWASTGEVLFIGIKSWTKKAPKPADKEAKDAKPAEKDAKPAQKDAEATKDGKEAKDKPEVSDVEVWHWKDVRILPEQKLQAERDRRKNDLAAWWLADGAVVPLGRGWAEEVTPLEGGRRALAVNETPHDASRMFGRPYVRCVPHRHPDRRAEGRRRAAGPSHRAEPRGTLCALLPGRAVPRPRRRDGQDRLPDRGPEVLVRRRRRRPPDARAVALPARGLDQGRRDGPAPRPLRRLGGPSRRLQGDPADARARGGGRAPGRPSRRPPCPTRASGRGRAPRGDRPGEADLSGGPRRMDQEAGPRRRRRRRRIASSGPSGSTARSPGWSRRSRPRSWRTSSRGSTTPRTSSSPAPR